MVQSIGTPYVSGIYLDQGICLWTWLPCRHAVDQVEKVHVGFNEASQAGEWAKFVATCA